MNLIFLLVLFVLLLALLLFTAALRIIFIFNSDNANINMTLLWLSPFLRALVTIEDTKPMLTIFLFNIRVYRSAIKPGKSNTNGMELIKLAKPTEVNVNAHYGFRDPFNTGVACGAINIASQFISIDSIQQVPDFMAENDYINIDATAKVNAGSMLLNLFSKHKANTTK